MGKNLRLELFFMGEGPKLVGEVPNISQINFSKQIKYTNICICFYLIDIHSLFITFGLICYYA